MTEENTKTWNKVSCLTTESDSDDTRWICFKCSYPCVTIQDKEPKSCPYNAMIPAWQIHTDSKYGMTVRAVLIDDTK